MILNTAPQNEAILSNVGEIGEFRIRNSAKAFSILSSGLYANKVRAIIRELSCNAVDSHAAAGKSDVPFEVHLPNAFEPYFSVRDFGTGLSHEQVTQIYTTYFESTKTASNEFIGALGLGSKSPFAYTDNFAVTAIQNGKKGIYSAFINGEGVPSVALMMQEDTDEPNGVEVKFSVESDFRRFEQEAKNVYLHFKLKPKVLGANSFTFDLISYETENLCPGVHVYASSNRASVAVMGNIAYPIELPQTEVSSMDPLLAGLLKCGLEIHFNIGDLDFQASREGLSYIATTVEAIKKRLQEIATVVTAHVKEEADKIDNLWERALFLEKKYSKDLWAPAVHDYVKASDLPTAEMSSRWSFLKSFKMKEQELAEKYNILIRSFHFSRGSSRILNSKPSYEHTHVGHQFTRTPYWDITVSKDARFVLNDTKCGAGERAKTHFRRDESYSYGRVYVLDKVDREKEMDTKGFFDELCNPPQTQISNASELYKQTREATGLTRNISLLTLEYRRRGNDRNLVWVDAGKLDSFDKSRTYYYLPLTGFSVVSKYEDSSSDAKHLWECLQISGLTQLSTLSFYGVRKTDLPDVQKLANWVNVEEHIESLLASVDKVDVFAYAAEKCSLPNFMFDRFGGEFKFDVELINEGSPFRKLLAQFQGVKTKKYHTLGKLCRVYGKNVGNNPDIAANQIVSEYNSLKDRYPMLAYLDMAHDSSVDENAANYINLVDSSKGA